MATVEQPHTQGDSAPAATPGSIPVVNPATGRLVSTVPERTAQEVAEIVARARAAQPAWAAAGFAQRGIVLRRAQKWLIDNRQRVVETLVSETGKTHEDALLVEIGYAAGALGFWAKQAPKYLADERVRSTNPVVLGRKLRVTHHPRGVVGVIGPWNLPLVNSFGDCIPALAAGNAVVLKPSEHTPLTSLLMAEALLECGMPDDVFQVATGAGATGAAVVDEVDMVMFTGSTPTGRKVAERAGR